MKGRLVALDHWEGREAAALMVDGRLEDLLVDPVDAPRLGTIFAARVERPMKGLGGAMVTWDGGEGFLRRAKGLTPGERLLVQVSGFAEPGKAPPVTTRLIFKSRYAIVTPEAGGLNVSRAIRDEDRRDALMGLAVAAMEGTPDRLGLILRSAAADADDDDILEDIAAMRSACEDATAQGADGLVLEGDGPHLNAWKEWTAPAQIETQAGSFAETGVLEAMDTLFSPVVPLGPHRMIIEPTRALTAVDVDTGRDIGSASALKANLAAARELPRQLRLRGVGGQVTVDFAPLSKRDRAQVETALRAGFRADSVETEVIGWTPLGHMELKRKRERAALTRG
ncbi:MAG: ribonuclease E/G [Pseudomonadota bacterium]